MNRFPEVYKPTRLLTRIQLNCLVELHKRPQNITL